VNNIKSRSYASLFIVLGGDVPSAAKVSSQTGTHKTIAQWE
jgi:hypothetical protein